MDPKLDHLKKIFRSLLLPEKNGATLHHFRKLYLEMEGEEIPYKRFGFNTDIELLKTMNGVVHMRLDNYGNMKVYAKKSAESQHIVDMVANQHRKCRPVSKGYNRLQTQWSTQRTQSSISSHGQKSNFGHQTNRNTSNFGSFRTPRALNTSNQRNSCYQPPMPNSVESNESKSWDQSMVSNATILTEIESQHQKNKPNPTKPSVDFSFKNNNQNDQLNGPANDVKNDQNEAVKGKPLDVPNKSDNTKAKYESESETESEDMEQLTGWQKSWCGKKETSKIPLHSFELSGVTNGEANAVELFPFSDKAVELNKIPEPKFDLFKLIIGTKLKISIPQTFSPHKFWFHFEDEARHLEILMENIMTFYEISRNDPIAQSEMPKSSIKVGKICAVKYRGEWHRGKILFVGVSVKIYFVDYGTVAEVRHEDLRFLATKFSKLPYFAHRGVLDKVKPTFGTWTIETLHFFEKMMKLYQYELISATITNINEEERTVYFKLTDETQIRSFDIAENLIMHNCAYPTKKSLANFQSRHLNEIRPSFDVLESGLYPSIEEIFDWHTEKYFNWIEFDDMRVDQKYLGYETIE